jgi:uncharacterized protein YkwD
VSNTRRRALALAGTAIVLVTILAGSVSSPASAATEAETYEWEFVCRINGERRAWGLAPLQVTGGLRTVARNWSVQLRDGYKSLVHNPNLSSEITNSVSASWSGAGENVGWGYEVGALHQAFMDSPSHRANILNGSYDYIGVGVATGSPDWTTHDFLDTTARLSTLADPIHSFSDVCMANPFFAAIEWMSDSGISTGFSNGTYRPMDVVTRQSMSAFMFRLAGSPGGSFPNPGFRDVPANHRFAREIFWMASTGTTTGYEDGTFRPQGHVSREAMSAFMYRFADAESSSTATGFRDVPSTHAFADEIAWMADAGITTGYEDGTYRPGSPVTRQAMSAFMQRLDRL